MTTCCSTGTPCWPIRRPVRQVRKQFDCVLVDEYQDTNALQAEILHLLSPEGKGLTAVGDDAQSIYSFRAATVRNILDFPKQYPNAVVVTLEQNYRSTLPILEAANGVIGLSPERFTKNLWSERTAGQRPALVTCEDEEGQTAYVIRRILTHREEGIDLRRQAVLFRASHHSILLEAELAARQIPFHKYGGLKFVETAHVKDLLAFLRLAENPRDEVAGRAGAPAAAGDRSGQGAAVDPDAGPGGGRFRRLGGMEAAGGRGRGLAAIRRVDGQPGRHGRGPPRAVPPRAVVLCSAVGGPIRSRPAAAARPGATGTDRRPLPHAFTDVAGDGPGSAQLDAGPGRPPAS